MKDHRGRKVLRVEERMVYRVHRVRRGSQGLLVVMARKVQGDLRARLVRKDRKG